MTPLGMARIAGEVGLAGGTITGTTLAFKYGGQVSSAKAERTQALEDAQSREGVASEQIANTQEVKKHLKTDVDAVKVCFYDENKTKQDCKKDIEDLIKTFEEMGTTES